MNEYTVQRPAENNPLKLDKYVSDAVKRIAKEHIELFGSVNRA
jgi:hypothetical protein